MKNTTLLILALVLVANVSAEQARVTLPADFTGKQLANAIIANSTDGRADLRVTFDDGEIMDVMGFTTDAQSYLDGKYTNFEFIMKLNITWMTRGRPLVDHLCLPENGKNCGNDEACDCYISQQCLPGNMKADKKGCVEPKPPTRAHLEGEEYVCDEGLVWKNDLTGCQEETVCPGGIIDPDGKCFTPKKEEPTTCCCIPALSLILAGTAAVIRKAI